MSVLDYELESLPSTARIVDHASAYLYLVRIDIDPSHEDEFNRWYDQEHLPGLSRADGVHAAHRYVNTTAARDGTHKYVAMYYLDCPSVRQRPAWRTASDTPWTARIHSYPRDKQATMFSRPRGPHAAT